MSDYGLFDVLRRKILLGDIVNKPYLAKGNMFNEALKQYRDVDRITTVGSSHNLPAVYERIPVKDYRKSMNWNKGNESMFTTQPVNQTLKKGLPIKEDIFPGLSSEGSRTPLEMTKEYQDALNPNIMNTMGIALWALENEQSRKNMKQLKSRERNRKQYLVEKSNRNKLLRGMGTGSVIEARKPGIKPIRSVPKYDKSLSFDDLHGKWDIDSSGKVRYQGGLINDNIKKTKNKKLYYDSSKYKAPIQNKKNVKYGYSIGDPGHLPWMKYNGKQIGFKDNENSSNNGNLITPKLNKGFSPPVIADGKKPKPGDSRKVNKTGSGSGGGFWDRFTGMGRKAVASESAKTAKTAGGKSSVREKIPKVTDILAGIRKSVNKSPYPKYMSNDKSEREWNGISTQNRLIRNREAQEDRELLAKQYEWKRKYGSPRNLLKIALKAKNLGVSPDLLFPEPYPTRKEKKQGLSERDMMIMRQNKQLPAWMQADRLNAQERGQRRNQETALTGMEMNRRINRQNRQDKREGLAGMNRKEEWKYNLGKHKVDVDDKRKRDENFFALKLARGKMYDQRLEYWMRMANPKLNDKQKFAFASERATEDTNKRFDPIEKELGY